MLFKKNRQCRTQLTSNIGKEAALRKVRRAGAMIELLDQRIFLSGNPSSYAVPTSISILTLTKSDDTTPYDVDYAGGSGMDTVAGTLSPDSVTHAITLTSTLSGFELKDEVSAAAKPTGGIKFHLIGAATGGILEVDAGDADTYMTITASTSSSATIATNDSNDSGGYEDSLGGGDTGYDYSGAGVNHITLQTNNLNGTSSPSVSDYYPDGGTQVYVPGLSGGLNLRVNTGDATHDRIYVGDNNTVGGTTTVQTGAGDDLVSLEENIGDDGANAIVDFGTGGSGHTTGLGDELDIGSAATATLEPVDGGSGPVVVDTVSVSGDAADDAGVLEVAGDATIGDLQIKAYGSVTITGSATIPTCDVGSLGSLYVEGSSNLGDVSVDYFYGYLDVTADSTISSLTLNQNTEADIEASCTITTATVDVSADLEVTAPSDITSLYVEGTANFTGDDTIGNLTADDDNGSVTLNDGTSTIDSADYPSSLLVNDDDLTFQESSTIEILTIDDGGSVTIQPRSASPASTDARVLTISENLDMGNDTSPGGNMDLNDNDLIVGPDGSSQFSYVQTLIEHAYDGGAWDHTGITSSLADSNHRLGYAMDSEIGSPSSFGGVSIGAGSAVIVKYTWAGDADLDGDVDGTTTSGDEGVVFANYNGHPKDWAHGDFNYDGTTNALDFNLLATNYGNSGL